jgi:hypothetical protein
MGEMSSGKVLREVTAALDRAGIPYMLTGSFASTLYGAGRATQDIDLVISATADQLKNFESALPEHYHRDLESALEALRHRSMFNLLDMEYGWKIDLIFQKPGAYPQQAFSRRTPAEVDEVPVIASTAEDLIIAKLDWARMGESLRQIDDVAGVLKVRRDKLDMTYIEQWVKQLGLAEQWAAAQARAAEQ